MRVWRGTAGAVALVVIGLFLAGCSGLGRPGPTSSETTSLTDTSLYGASECDVNLTPGSSSTAAFRGMAYIHVEPGEPIVVPGVSTPFNWTFHNHDCRSFGYSVPGPCSGPIFQVGDDVASVAWDGNGSGYRPGWSAFHHCVVGPRDHVPPGGSLVRRPEWNGSFQFWDHSALERGDGWVLKTFWAEAGVWNASSGLPSPLYNVDNQTKVLVESNGLNLVGAIPRHGCGTWLEPIVFEDLKMTASATKGSSSAPITFWVDYTLRLNRTGCYLMGWSPELRTVAGGIRAHCGAGSNVDPLVWISTTQKTVRGHLSFTMDGQRRCENPFVVPNGAGTYNVTFDPGQYVFRRTVQGPLPWIHIEWS